MPNTRGRDPQRAHVRVDRPRIALIVVASVIFALAIAVNLPPTADILDAAMGFKWSAGFVSFLQANTQGLLILVGFSLLLEFVGLERSKYAERRLSREVGEFMDAALVGGQAEFLIRTGLERHLEPAAAQQVLDGLHLHRGQMQETFLRIRVAPDWEKENGLIRLEHTMDFLWLEDTFLFCLARTTAQLSAVTTRLDQVLETRVHMTAKPAFDDLNDRQLRTDLNPFSLVSSSGEGTPLRLEKISASESARLAASAGVRSADVRFYRARGVAKGRLRIANVQTVPATTQSTWWLADRLLELRSISVDVSRVSSVADTELVMFLGAAHTSPTPNAAGVWESSDIGWVLPGHGLSIAWRYVDA